MRGGGEGNKKAIQAPDLSLEGRWRRKNCLERIGYILTKTRC
jgi:hypothetical protein